MNFPTLKEITDGLPDLDKGKAEDLLKLLKDAISSDDDNAVDDAMEEANEILKGHGVEAIQGEDAFVDKYWRDTILLYVNLGDTYDTTICYDTEKEKFFVGSWGDFLEAWEQGEEESEEDDEEEGEEEESSVEDAHEEGE